MAKKEQPSTDGEQGMRKIIQRDAEILAIQRILRILDRVPLPARGRVVGYLVERYRSSADPMPCEVPGVGGQFASKSV